MAYLQQRANHDNARNGVRHRHQRRMQRMGDIPYHVVTHHAGQREDSEMAEELFRRHVGQPAEENNRQRYQRIFAPRRRRFHLFFRRFHFFRRGLRLSGDLNRRRRPGDFAFTHHGHTAHHHVIEIDDDIAVFLFAQQLQQVHQVGAVELGGLGRQTAWQVGITDNFHAVGGGHHFARHGVLAVAAVLRGEIDHHAARLHGVNHFPGDQLRRRLARN